MKDKLPAWLVEVFAGVGAALAFAIPVVDDGLVVSEVLGIALAGLAGAGLTALRPGGEGVQPDAEPVRIVGGDDALDWDDVPSETEPADRG